MTANQVELAVAAMLDYRQCIIVPNVSYGLPCLNYEADMVVLRDSMWADEIEIKVTASDIRADKKKKHNHNCVWFRSLYFAVPEELATHPDIPERAGIYAVNQDKYGICRAYKVRAAKLSPNARKFDPKNERRLLRLAAMRTWTLKKHLANAMNRDSRNFAEVAK